MKENKSSISKEEEKNRKKQKDIKLELILSIILILVIGGSIMLKDIINYQKKNYTNSINNYYNYDYKYILDYYFGEDYFIYLLSNDEVKVVGKTPIYAECKEQNCFLDTGNFEYEENTLQFSDEAMTRVKDLIISFFKDTKKTELDLTTLTLTEDQIRMINGIILDSEEVVMFDKYLKIEEEKDEIKDQNDNVIVTTIGNKISESKYENIQKIGNYLNEIVEKDMKEYYEEYQNLISEGQDMNNYNQNANLNLEIKYIGPFNVSFTYVKEGIYRDFSEEGYTFKISTGEVVQISNGLKKEYHEKAIKNFRESELYKNAEEELEENWEEILYDIMFETGNWYENENTITFLIPTYRLGIPSVMAQIVEITIENE